MKLHPTTIFRPKARALKVKRRSMRLPSIYPRMSILQTHRSPIQKLAWIFGLRL